MDYSVQLEFKASMDALKGALDGLMGQVGQLAKATEATNQSLTEMGSKGAASATLATGSFIELGAAMEGVRLIADGIKAGFEAMGHGIKAFMEEGIGFDRQIETAKIGVGALIASQTNMYDSQGQLLQGQNALNAGLDEGEKAVQRLRVGSFQTTATFRELVTAYQQGLGPMLQHAKLNLQDTTDLTVKFAQAAGALGLDMNLLGHELRTTFSGQFSTRFTRIAAAMGIQQGDIDRWIASNTLMQELNKRFEIMALTGDKVEQSWRGVASNVQHAFESFSGETVEPFFQKVKEGLHDALHDAFDLAKGDFSAQWQPLIQTGKDLFADLGDLAKGALANIVSLAKDLAGWLGTHREQVKAIFDAFTDVAKEVGGLVVDVIRMVGHIAGAQENMGTFSDMVRKVAMGVAEVRDGLSYWIPELSYIGQTIEASILEPLGQALRAVGAVLKFTGQDDGSIKKMGEDIGKMADGYVRGADEAHRMALENEDAHKAVNELAQSWVKDAEEAKKAENAHKAARIAAKPSEAQDSGPDGTNKIKQFEIGLEQALASAVHNTTLAEQEAMEQKKAALALDKKRAELTNIFQTTNMTQAQYQADWTKLEQIGAAERSAIEQKFADQRQALQEKVENELGQTSSQALDRRLASIRAHFEKIRAEQVKLGTFQADQARTDAAEQEAISQARFQQTQQDIQRLTKALQELAKEKGRALTFDEQQAALTRLSAQMGTTDQALATMRMEITRQKDAWGGLQAGIADFVVKAQNSFQNFKQFATSTMNTIQTSVGTAIDNMITKHQKLGDALKTIWKSITSAIIKELAMMAAQWLVSKIAAAAFGDSMVATAETNAAAQQIQAGAEIWSAYGGIPFVGPGLAVAAMLLMETTLAANAGAAKATATARATGGAVGVNGPELTLLGERGIEVVAPEKDFKDYAWAMLKSGASLQAGMQATSSKVAGYQASGAAYTRMAAQAPHHPASTGEMHMHFHGSVTAMGGDMRTKQQVGRFLQDAMRTVNRTQSGQNTPGQALS